MQTRAPSEIHTQQNHQVSQREQLYEQQQQGQEAKPLAGA